MTRKLARSPRFVLMTSVLLAGPLTLAHDTQTTPPPGSTGAPPAEVVKHATPADLAAWDAFAGEWRAQPDAARVVEAGVHQATASMSFIARPIARRRLFHRFPAPTELRLHRDDDLFVIEFRGPGALVHRLPISGAEVFQHDARLSIRLEGPALRHAGATEEGRRENLFRLGNTPNVLTMETTITSPQLPGPVRYLITFERVVATPTPAGG